MEKVWRTAVKVEFEVGPIVDFDGTTVKVTASAGSCPGCEVESSGAGSGQSAQSAALIQAEKVRQAETAAET
jgi:hypothetical protein